jgi:hypothetical protein
MYGHFEIGTGSDTKTVAPSQQLAGHPSCFFGHPGILILAI